MSEQQVWDDLLASEGMPAELDTLTAQLERAGVDHGTPVDTFMQMNGRNIFVVTEGMDYEATEGIMATLS